MKTNNQDPRTSTAAEKALWQRINDFSPDQPGVPFPFSKKLAKEQRWTSAFTAEAIAEYKKFVYLCCILPQGASPPRIVDEVWHLHLTYTQNYWEYFCEKILQRKLHHHPSTGGRQERHKHDHWQRDTLTQYQLTFGTAPPTHIWQDRPGIPRAPRFQRFIRALRLAPLLLLLLLLPGCNGPGTPTIIGIMLLIIFSGVSATPGGGQQDHKKKGAGGDGSSCGGGGGGSCSSGGCGSGCGGGCGGCGGGGCGS